MQTISAKQGIFILFVVAMTQGLGSCDSGPKQLEAFHQYFHRLEVDRQKAVRSKGLVNTLRTSGQFHVADVVWCGDNKTLVSNGGTDTSVLIWDTQSSEMLHTLNRGAGSRAIACGENGRFVASGISDKEQTIAVRVWDISEAGATSDIEGPFPPFEGRKDSFAMLLSFSSDNSRLYAHYVNRKRDHRLVAYEIPSWKTISDFKLSGRLDYTKPVLTIHGQLFAYGLDSRDIVVINTLNGAEKIRFHIEKLRPHALVFGRDDKTIFVGGTLVYDGPHRAMADQVVEEYSLDDGRLQRSIVTRHLYEIGAMAFRQDSGLLITASADKTVELRNAAGSLIATLGDKTNQVYSIDIRPDGEQVASAGGVINIWSLRDATGATSPRGAQ